MMMLSVAIIATLVAVSHVEGTDYTLDVVQVPVLFNFTIITDNSSSFVFHFINALKSQV